MCHWSASPQLGGLSLRRGRTLGQAASSAEGRSRRGPRLGAIRSRHPRWLGERVPCSRWSRDQIAKCFSSKRTRESIESPRNRISSIRGPICRARIGGRYWSHLGGQSKGRYSELQNEGGVQSQPGCLRPRIPLHLRLLDNFLAPFQHSAFPTPLSATDI